MNTPPSTPSHSPKKSAKLVAALGLLAVVSPLVCAALKKPENPKQKPVAANSGEVVAKPSVTHPVVSANPPIKRNSSVPTENLFSPQTSPFCVLTNADQISIVGDHTRHSTEALLRMAKATNPKNGLESSCQKIDLAISAAATNIALYLPVINTNEITELENAINTLVEKRDAASCPGETPKYTQFDTNPFCTVDSDYQLDLVHEACTSLEESARRFYGRAAKIIIKSTPEHDGQSFPSNLDMKATNRNFLCSQLTRGITFSEGARDCWASYYSSPLYEGNGRKDFIGKQNLANQNINKAKQQFDFFSCPKPKKDN